MTLAQFAAGESQSITITPPVVGKPEVELPLTQKDIFDISSVETWACVRAASGDKEEYTFSESKFGHTWAADSVDTPRFTQASSLTIDKAKLLICESILFGVGGWLLLIQSDDSATRLDMSKCIRTVAIEASSEYGINSTDFIAAMGSLDALGWFNIRQIHIHIREKAQPVADPHPGSHI